MVALAVLTLVVWALYWARKDPKIRYETIITGAIVGIPSGYIVSRLLHVIDFWDYFMENPGEMIGGSGLTIYGGERWGGPAAVGIGCGGALPLGFLLVASSLWSLLAVADAARRESGTLAAARQGLRVLGRRLGAIVLIFGFWLIVSLKVRPKT